MKIRRLAYTSSLCVALALPALAQTSMPTPASERPAAAGAQLGVGTLKRIDAQRRVVTIEHQRVAGANMPPMAMEFRLDAGVSTSSLGEGQPIAFVFAPSRGGMSISDIRPVLMAEIPAPTAGASAPNAGMKDHPGMSGTSLSGMDSGAMDKETMAKCHEMMKRK